MLYIVKVGDKEVETGSLSVRIRNGENRTVGIEELLKEVEGKTAGMPFENLSLPAYLSRRPVFRG